MLQLLTHTPWYLNTDGERAYFLRIRDNRGLKPVVLHQKRPEPIIEARPARKGPTLREYQNTLISALSDVGAFARFKEDVKTGPASEGVVVRAIRLGEQDR